MAVSSKIDQRLCWLEVVALLTAMDDFWNNARRQTIERAE
jgi:hypothetical protein